MLSLRSLAMSAGVTRTRSPSGCAPLVTSTSRSRTPGRSRNHCPRTSLGAAALVDERGVDHRPARLDPGVEHRVVALARVRREAERPQRQPGQRQLDPFDAQRVHGADDDEPAARPRRAAGRTPVASGRGTSRTRGSSTSSRSPRDRRRVDGNAVGLVGRVGEVLGLQRQPVALPVRAAARAVERAVEEVARVELDPGLRRRHGQDATAVPGRAVVRPRLSPPPRRLSTQLWS